MSPAATCSRSSTISSISPRSRPAAWISKNPLSPLPCRLGKKGDRMNIVMIVENNDKNMKRARDVLQNKGYKTLEDVTSEDGVKLAKDHVPDLVLMDIQLPGINGIDAFKQIR